MLARPRSRWFGCCIRPNRSALDEVAAAGFDIAGLAARHTARHRRARGAPPHGAAAGPYPDAAASYRASGLVASASPARNARECAGQ
jgi:hypothetical protein